MSTHYENKELADALSTRVARDFSPAVWQSLFVTQTEAVATQAGNWSVVCAESPWDGRLSQDAVRRELAVLAQCHGGHLDAAPGATSLAAFATPACALRAALALQRDGGDARLRVAVVTAPAALARFRAEGVAVKVLAGPALDRAPAVLQRAGPGTVQLCAATYGALAGFSAELDACVVVPEYEGEELSQVALTLLPARGLLPAFAGREQG